MIRLIKSKRLVQIICLILLSTIFLTIILQSKSQFTQSSSANYESIINLDWNYKAIVEDYDPTSNSSVIPKSCDTIHLATVCGGYNSTRDFYVLLKSILFYRTVRIKYHLLVDQVSKQILTKLFETWPIADFDHVFYDCTNYEREISWIPTHHYSNQFGLLKLLFPSILQKEAKINRSIILDTDMLALGDIKHVWSKFDQLQDQGAALGLVENQSDWYLRRHKNGLIQDRLIWPAINRGFNTGLILVDLRALQMANWDLLWRQVAEIELITRLSTALADQDIVNTVLKTQPTLVYVLPANFNLQLNDHATLEAIFHSSNNFRLVHWNSPMKMDFTHQSTSIYRKWHHTFLNWDASLLTDGVCITSTLSRVDRLENVTRKTNEETICNIIKPRPDERLRTYLDFMEFVDNRNSRDITLVVHLSLDRLRAFDELAAHWQGPISAAIYLAESETSLLIESIQDSENLWARKNIGYHLVYREHGFSYPINRLRNIALERVHTDYVFLADVDFLPSLSMYNYLNSLLNNKTLDSDSVRIDQIETPRVLVIPAFENSQYKFEFPASKPELERQLNLGSVSMFRAQLWSRGHSPTDYTRWRSSSRLYQVHWQPDYEPFIVASRNIVRFDERFVGFGWNKVEHIMQLTALGYEFWVLPNAFVIHQFHPASYDIVRHRSSLKYRTCIWHLKRTFSLELIEKFPRFLEILKASNAVPSGSYSDDSTVR